MEAGIGKPIQQAAWLVELDREFDLEFRQLATPVRQKIVAMAKLIVAMAKLLEVFGPRLGRPSVDTLKGSRHPNMKELRCDADGGVWRVAFASDIKRKAILLIAGNKTGIAKDRFYRDLIGIADQRFDRHQRDVAKEGRTP